MTKAEIDDAVPEPDDLPLLALGEPMGGPNAAPVGGAQPPFWICRRAPIRCSVQPARSFETLAVLSALYAVAPNLGEDDLRRIPVPMLILDGAEDEMINPDQPARLAVLIPESELIFMPDTGHFAPIAGREAFNQIVLDYLAG